ncbi:MAG: dihydrofolate reductase family protein [archaeon]
MRKLILYIATSLDLFIARKNGSVDWLFQEGEFGYTKFYSTIGTVIMGRKTWNAACGFEKQPYMDKECIVFSKKGFTPNQKYVKVVTKNVPSFVEKLKKGKGKPIWLVGGGQLASLLVNEGLVDEMWLYIHPRILGEGTPLLEDVGEISLKHISTHAFPEGLVEMKYAVKEGKRSAPAEI